MMSKAFLLSYTDCYDQFLMKRPFRMCFQKSSVNTLKNAIRTCHSIITLSQTTATTMASFNIPSSTEEERPDRLCISRRADPGVFVANRADVIPQRGQLIKSTYVQPFQTCRREPTTTTTTIMKFLKIEHCTYCGMDTFSIAVDIYC